MTAPPDAPITTPAAASGRARRRGHRSAGQIVPLFALSIALFMGLCALVIDVTWYWANSLRIQRAADAAALAGAVMLPDDPTSAYARARAEATKNGYTDGVGGIVITTQVDPQSDRRLMVSINAPVGTFFMRVVGISSIPAARSARGEYVLPVPMGSPENYYGVFGVLREATFTSTSTATGGTTTGVRTTTSVPSTVWTNPGNVGTDNAAYAQSGTTSGSAQQWRNYGISPTPTVNSIDGITVEMNAWYSGTAGPTDCELSVELSWNNGTSWTTPQTLALASPTSSTLTFGGATDTWGRTWTAAELADGIFRTRLTWLPGAGCTGSRTARVDIITVDVAYTNTTTTTTTTTTSDPLEGPGTACPNGAANCYMPDGVSLNPRGFWATMNTQGSANVNGDAYQPYYDTPTSGVAPACSPSITTACHDPVEYYNYSVEMPPGSTGGYVYIFDPVFCATALNRGTGDRWFGGANAVSSWYELYNTNETPYEPSDDTLVATSGSLFTGSTGTDTTMAGPAVGSGRVECRQQATSYGDGRDYHNAWFLLNPGAPLSGGPLGTSYRIHTTGTDPSSPTAQRNANGEQSFAIFASASGSAPQVYGLGAMQMFTPLSASGSTAISEFYLAQIPASHAGKTLQIRLWDPGDTNPLTASLSFLVPNSGGWATTNFSYTSARGSTNSGALNCTASGTNVASVTTATPTSQFNGCWLTISIPIPMSYAADQDGWWKIRYTMNGTGTSSDVTTWTASVKGNPVHLRLP